MSKALQEYISSRGLSGGVSANTPEERREQLRHARDAGTAAKIVQGFWLAQIRDAEGQEAFLSAAAELRIGRSAAYDAVATLELFNRLPDLTSVAALGQLEPTKALTFKAWSDAELTAFARGQPVRGIELDSAVELSADKLKAQQRAWQIENEDQLRKLHQEKNAADIKVNQLKQEVARLSSRSSFVATDLDLPMFERIVRDESFVLTEEIRASLDGLEATAKLNLFTKLAKVVDADRQPMAAGTFYFRLAGVLAQGMQLLRRLEAAYPDVCTGGMHADYQFSEAEIEHHRELSAQLDARAAEGTKERHNARENTVPGKRGRKRGSGG